MTHASFYGVFTRYTGLLEGIMLGDLDRLMSKMCMRSMRSMI